MHRIFSGDGRLVLLNIRKSARDHRRSQPLVQQPPVLIILCILCIDVEWMVLLDGSAPSRRAGKRESPKGRPSAFREVVPRIPPSAPSGRPTRERGRPGRILSLELSLSFPAMRQPAPPAGGNRRGPAEAEPWRRCHSIRVVEMGEAMPRIVRAGRPRSRGPFSHDVVTPTSQYCRSIRAPLVIEGTPSVFVPIRVHSWFVFISKTKTAGCFSSA